jgi:hypothetical protein
VRLKGQQVVLYERSGGQYQCLLNNFKSYAPQLLIQYLIRYYDPSNHELKLPTRKPTAATIPIFERPRLRRDPLNRRMPKMISPFRGPIVIEID